MAMRSLIESNGRDVHERLKVALLESYQRPRQLLAWALCVPLSLGSYLCVMFFVFVFFLDLSLSR